VWNACSPRPTPTATPRPSPTAPTAVWRRPDRDRRPVRAQHGGHLHQRLLTGQTKGFGTPNAGTWTYTTTRSASACPPRPDPDGNVRTYSYDDHDNLIAESDARGFTTNYQYDAQRNLVEKGRPERRGDRQPVRPGRPHSRRYRRRADLTSTTVTQSKQRGSSRPPVTSARRRFGRPTTSTTTRHIPVTEPVR